MKKARDAPLHGSDRCFDARSFDTGSSRAPGGRPQKVISELAVLGSAPACAGVRQR